MSGGFGRKGVVAGAPVPRTTGNSTGGDQRPALRESGADDGLSPAARAFLAAERTRTSEPHARIDPVAGAAASGLRLAPTKPKGDRSMVVAYVLWWFGAFIAAHRFYLGAHRSALIQLGLFWGGLAIGAMMSKQSSMWIGGVAVPPPGIFMIAICVIWVIVDFFLIPGLLRRYRAVQQDATLAHVFA